MLPIWPWFLFPSHVRLIDIATARRGIRMTALRWLACSLCLFSFASYAPCVFFFSWLISGDWCKDCHQREGCHQGGQGERVLRVCTCARESSLWKQCRPFAFLPYILCTPKEKWKTVTAPPNSVLCRGIQGSRSFCLPPFLFLLFMCHALYRKTSTLRERMRSCTCTFAQTRSRRWTRPWPWWSLC